VAHDLHEALQAAGADPEIFVIGGGEIYRQALPLADRLYVTEVDVEAAGVDAWFPEIDPARWTLVEERRADADAENPHAARYRTYAAKRERRGTHLV
jgi:dihydrofolate reductase